MIATGNHLRFMIRCALQHAPTLTRPYGYAVSAADYPSGFLPRQKATSPDMGWHGCGANRVYFGRWGGRGDGCGGEAKRLPYERAIGAEKIL